MPSNVYLYSSKAVCRLCWWKMRGRMDRKVKVYICSKYNKNGLCERNTIKESEISEFVQDRKIDKIIVTNKEIKIG